jgi:hypothetical protein
MAEYIECVKGSSYSANIVDENNVFLGWEDGQECCEIFNVEIVDEDGKILEDWNCLSPYVFDTLYIDESRYECVQFRLYDKMGVEKDLFVNISNEHNGYYSHGFEFGVTVKIIKSGRV